MTGARIAEALAVERPDGVVLRGRRWGPAPGVPRRPTVVVVHGLGEHGGRYDALARSLTAAGHPVVAHDQRGHGGSPGRRGILDDVDVLVEDLLAVRRWAVQAVGVAGLPILYGHSMGGLVAVRALQSREDPWEAAVLSAPWLATALSVPPWKRALEPLLASLAPRLTVASGLRADHLTRDPEQRRLWAEDPLVHDRVSGKLVAAVTRAQKAALSEGVPSGLPILLLCPGDDPVVDIATVVRWGQETGGARLRMVHLPGRRHEPHNDIGREEVFSLVVDWLRDPRGAEQGPREWVSSSERPPGAPRQDPPQRQHHD